MTAAIEHPRPRSCEDCEALEVIEDLSIGPPPPTRES
jgi:hypothetical protein